MTIKDIALIKKMLKMQAKLDKAIMDEYGLDKIDEDKLSFAILDEVGELVDIWHFVLSWQNNFNDGEEGLLADEQLMEKVDNSRWAIEEHGKGIVIKLADLSYFSLRKVEPLIAITEYIGFTIEQVYEAYCGKNKINYQRLKEGY